MKFLQRAYGHLAPDQRLDAHHRRGSPRYRRDAGDVMGYRRAADLVPVLARTWALRGVDDEVDVSGADEFDRVARAVLLVVFRHDRAGDAVPAKHISGADRCHDREPEVGQALDREDHAT